MGLENGFLRELRKSTTLPSALVRSGVSIVKSDVLYSGYRVVCFDLTQILFCLSKKFERFLASRECHSPPVTLTADTEEKIVDTCTIDHGGVVPIPQKNEDGTISVTMWQFSTDEVACFILQELKVIAEHEQVNGEANVVFFIDGDTPNEKHWTKARQQNKTQWTKLMDAYISEKEALGREFRFFRDTTSETQLVTSIYGCHQAFLTDRVRINEVLDIMREMSSMFLSDDTPIPVTWNEHFDEGNYAVCVLPCFRRLERDWNSEELQRKVVNIRVNKDIEERQRFDDALRLWSVCGAKEMESDHSMVHFKQSVRSTFPESKVIINSIDSDLVAICMMVGDNTI